MNAEMKKITRNRTLPDATRYNMNQRIKDLQALIEKENYKTMRLTVNFDVAALDYFVNTVNAHQGNTGYRAYTKMNLLSHIEDFFNVDGSATVKTYERNREDMQNMRDILNALNSHTENAKTFGKNAKLVKEQAHKKAAKMHNAQIYNPPETVEGSRARNRRLQAGSLTAALAAAVFGTLYVQSNAPIYQLFILIVPATVFLMGIGAGNSKREEINTEAVSVNSLMSRFANEAQQTKVKTEKSVQAVAKRFPRRYHMNIT